MIIELLKSQLEAANAANITLSEEMKSMRMSFESTISDLRKTITNLEALLKERDENLNKANAQMRGLKATFLPKQSEKQKPASTEEALAKAEAQERAIKARGNNGAKRKDYFTIETKEDDVYPEEIDADQGVEIGVRDVIRYEMIRRAL